MAPLSDNLFLINDYLFIYIIKCSDLNAKIGTLQVATLTITAPTATPGQEVSIANSAYTIKSNFNNALAVTVPIYCWGTYTISANGFLDKAITIDNTKFDYALELLAPGIIYDHGKIGLTTPILKNASFQDGYILTSTWEPQIRIVYTSSYQYCYFESDTDAFNGRFWKNNADIGSSGASYLVNGVNVLKFPLGGNAWSFDLFLSYSKAVKITKIYFANQ